MTHPDEDTGIRFVGVGTPADIAKQRDERIEQVRKQKNKTASQAAQRVATVLTRSELRDLQRRRSSPPKEVKSFRWMPHDTAQCPNCHIDIRRDEWYDHYRIEHAKLDVPAFEWVRTEQQKGARS